MGWMRPEAYKRARKYFGEMMELAQLFQPVLPEEHLEPSNAQRAQAKFDASVHPQFNYTEALCRRMLPTGLEDLAESSAAHVNSSKHGRNSTPKSERRVRPHSLSDVM